MYAANGGPKMKWGDRFYIGVRAPLDPAGDGPFFIVRIRVHFGVQSGFI